jgi:hypothetical protein
MPREIGCKISKNIAHTQILTEKKLILTIKHHLYSAFTRARSAKELQL